MRIAMVGCRGIPARWGGIERVVEDVTRELCSRGHEVIVYGRGGYVVPGQAPSAGKVIITPGLGGKHFDTISHTFTAMLDVCRRKVDVVHVHSPGPALTSMLPVAAGVPVVFTVHAPDWQRDKWNMPAKAMIRSGLRCGMKFASAYTAVSEPLASELSQRFGKEVEFVPNGVRPAPKCTTSFISGLKLPPGRYALFVGRVAPEKRLDLLIRAWADVTVNMPLIVAAELTNDKYCRDCCKLARNKNIRFIGGVYGDDLSELYANTAIVIQPSVLEGMSLVLLEAASHGKCIICTDIDENVALLGDSGVYFNVDNAAQLSQVVSRCLEDEALRGQMGDRALSRAESFTVEKAAEAYESIYLRLSEIAGTSRQ